MMREEVINRNRLAARKRTSLFWSGMKEVFRFSFALGKKNKRSRLFAFLSFFPVGLSLFFRFHQDFSSGSSFDGLYLFTNAIILFSLQFLILILALFYGCSVGAEDLETGTWSYLVTRPLWRSSILLGKFLASLVLMMIMVSVGVIASFFILNLERAGQIAIYGILLKDLVVLTLGLLAYSSLFTFLGVAVRRSIFFGLIFSFGWENVVQYFPGSTQRFAIAHYLKSLLPLPSTGRFSFLTFRLEPTRPGWAVFALIAISTVFLALACLVFFFKEPRGEE